MLQLTSNKLPLMESWFDGVKEYPQLPEKVVLKCSFLSQVCICAGSYTLIIQVTYCNGMNSEAHMRIQLFFKPGIEDTCKTVDHHQNPSCFFFFLAEIYKPVLKFV